MAALDQLASANYLVDCGNTRFKLSPHVDPLHIQAFDDDELRTWFQQQPLEGKSLVALGGNEARSRLLQTLCYNEGVRYHIYNSGDWEIAGSYPSMGLDRIAAGIAAMEHVKRNLIVVDAGTMLTVTAWQHDADQPFALHYHGGFIAPGRQVSLSAMHQSAPALPDLQIDPTQVRLGSDTPSNMQAAINVGWPAMAQALIAEAWTELSDAQIVLTGGDAASLQAKDAMLHEDLVLRGLQVYVQQ